LAVVGLSALTGARRVPVQEALQMEQRMYEAKVAAEQVQPERAEHKRWSAEELDEIRQQELDGEAVPDETAQTSNPDAAELTSVSAQP
jgi:hypothetical protein